MVFRPNYQYVQERGLQLGAGVADVGSVPYFQANAIIRIPEQPVWYMPPVSEVLKFAWIQYLALFALVAFLLSRLNSFVFGHRVSLWVNTCVFVCECMRIDAATTAAAPSLPFLLLTVYILRSLVDSWWPATLRQTLSMKRWTK